jgi:hypothetical protein
MNTKKGGMGMLPMWTILGSQRPNRITFISPLAFDPLTKLNLLVLLPGFYIQEQLLPTHTMAAQLFDAAALTLFFKDANNMGCVIVPVCNLQ